jgi:predicted TIM-barrel fold metal-dependent hydrolase
MSQSSQSADGEMCAGPNLDLSKPRLIAPPGATDTHLHFFGPQETYPFLTPRNYTPPDATPASYIALAKALGIERAVIIQPSIYGTDNRRQIDAARYLDIPTRIVVVTPTNITDRELESLHMAGARGVRIILSQPGGVPTAEIERFSSRLHEFGWHIQIMMTFNQMVELEPRIAKLRCRTVIDHMGSIQAGAGLNQQAFGALVRLVGGGCWTKLSAAYRLSTQPAPYRDLIPFVSALVRERPDRLLWGTDWPQAYFSGAMPSNTDLFDLLLEWVPDENTRNRILVRNPEELYGF